MTASNVVTRPSRPRRCSWRALLPPLSPESDLPSQSSLSGVQLLGAPPHSGSRTQPQHHRCGPGSAWLFLRRLCRCLAAPTSRPRSAALQPSSSSSGCHRRVCLHPSRSWSRGPVEWSRLWTPSRTHILRQSRYMRVAEEASCVGTVMQTLVTHRFVMRRCLYTTDPVLGLHPP